MKGEQLSLLSWVRPTAEIVYFPCDREVSFVREAAQQIRRRSGPHAEKFWRTECNRLYGRLQLRGWDDAQITAEIDRFARAVRKELSRDPDPVATDGVA